MSKGTSLKAIRLTKRDEAILTYLGIRGGGSIQNIHAFFWPGRKERTCQERMMQLVKAGYIHAERVSMKHTLHHVTRYRDDDIFWLSTKGKRALCETAISTDRRTDFITKRPTASELSHTLIMNAFLDAHYPRLLAFTHERLLKGEYIKVQHFGGKGRVADARITLATDKSSLVPAGTHLIEIDGDYYGKRLLAKVRALGATNESVIWLVRTSHRARTLQNLAKKLHISLITPIVLPSLWN